MLVTITPYADYHYHFRVIEQPKNMVKDNYNLNYFFFLSVYALTDWTKLKLIA